MQFYNFSDCPLRCYFKFCTFANILYKKVIYHHINKIFKQKEVKIRIFYDEKILIN